MKKGYKAGLYAFAGIVFLLFSLCFAKTIELWNKYQEASKIVLLCEAREIAILSNNEELFKKLEVLEAEIKKNTKTDEVIKQIGTNIDTQHATQEQKEAFKEILNTKYLSEE